MNYSRLFMILYTPGGIGEVIDLYTLCRNALVFLIVCVFVFSFCVNKQTDKQKQTDSQWIMDTVTRRISLKEGFVTLNRMEPKRC